VGREDLRAAYSDLMKTLHEETYYEGIYQPEEVKYAAEEIIGEKELLKQHTHLPQPPSKGVH